MIRLGKLGLVVYVTVFTLAALYASLLLLSAMRGLNRDRVSFLPRRRILATSPGTG